MDLKWPRPSDGDDQDPSHSLTSKSSVMDNDGTHYFMANDGVRLHYQDCLPIRLQANGHPHSGDNDSFSDKVIILLHGWTGSSNVWSRCVHRLGSMYRMIGVDLRGHGESDKPATGFHVSRLAMDLKNLIDHLKIPKGTIVGVGASLGCAVLWSYLELFGASAFSDLIFIDQSPYQNHSADGSWGPQHGSKGCNSAATLAHLQATLIANPENFYKGMHDACFAYRSHPLPTDTVTDERRVSDETYLVDIAKKCDPVWLSKLMADHTNIDWRASIAHTLGPEAMTREDCHTRVMVIASSRSGCFNPEGPLEVVKILERAGRRLGQEGVFVKGVTVDWGGHWLYWEDAEKFNRLLWHFISDDPRGEVFEPPQPAIPSPQTLPAA